MPCVITPVRVSVRLTCTNMLPHCIALMNCSLHFIGSLRGKFTYVIVLAAVRTSVPLLLTTGLSASDCYPF